MSFRSAVRELFGRDVTEAAKAPARIPERAGFEYGIPPQGLTEYSQAIGASTQTDRRSLMTQLYEVYLTCPWSWASVNAISRTVTAGGLVMDWDTDDGEGDQDAPDKPANALALERLLAFCNDREDIRQLMRGVIVDLLVFGDAFIEVVWLGSVPVALYSLDAPSMYPIADQHGRITGYRQVTDLGQRAEFEPRDVIHISLDSPRSGIFGVSPTQANLLPITSWLFAAATCKEIFRKGDPPTIHTDLPAGNSAGEVNRWVAQYMQRNIGPRNIGVPITTKGGGTVNELHQGKIADYIAFLDQKRDEILAGYGVPPAQAGVIESGNLGGGTGESQRKMFLTNTCQPIAELVLEKLNFHLTKQAFGVEGWHLKFGDVDMRDSETIEKIRDMRIRNATYTVNRARAEINEPPVDGGDIPVIIDRENMVILADLPAYSQALIANKLGGSAGLEIAEPQAGKPTTLRKAEPAPAPPPAMAAPQPVDGAPVDSPPGESFAADWRAVSEAWTQEYRQRRQRAMEQLPQLTSVP